jgi:hypothetical protein
MMDSMKKSPFGSKDSRATMLAAEELWAKDPASLAHLDGIVKAAIKGRFLQTAKYFSAEAIKSMRKEKKPNTARFNSFRQLMLEGADVADSTGDAKTATFLLEKAVESLDFLISRNPTDMALKDEQRNLSGRLTISRGKYESATDFRESLKDAEAQALIHDTDRIQQGAHTLKAIVDAARKEADANPEVPGKINALVDALLKSENDEGDLEAIVVLLAAYERLRNYNFKLRADETRLRMLKRTRRALVERAKTSKADEDLQQARLAALEELETEITVGRERVEQYPTDLRMKFRLGDALFRAHRYEDAIPVLQAAQVEPRHRFRALLLIGRSFYEDHKFGPATEVLKEALEAYELSGDDLQKEILYWLGRAAEADGKKDEAKSAFGRLLRIDYNYADGDARRRLESIGK